MIRRFSSLYAGHVDLEDLGYGGARVNDRRQTDEHLASVFDKTQAICEVMDRCDYSTIWLAEHHFQIEGYECIPNIPLLAVHLAHLTEKLKFGCGFNIAPAWHPLRLAEDFATADILTNGRVIFGVGRGYHTREVEVLGSPLLDQDANRELFEEQVELILKAFNEPTFSHSGPRYSIPEPVPYRGYEVAEIGLVPRPKHLPAEIYQPIVSANPRGLDFMAKHGIKGIAGGGAGIGGARPGLFEAFRDAQMRHGREVELGEGLVLGLSIWVADSKEQAIEQARPYFEEHIKMFAPLGFFPGLDDDQLAQLDDPAIAPTADLPKVEDAVEMGAWIAGPAEYVTERLLEVQEKWPGLEEIMVGYPVATPQRVLVEQLERFAAEVMPAFDIER